ncbi:MAG: hypothetical protein IJZ23_07970 [Roseburia sp.]|nr:hypothetical protein [Roseburia sp.]
MKYAYTVKYKGNYYPAGTEVPVEVVEESKEESEGENTAPTGTDNTKGEGQGSEEQGDKESKDGKSTGNEYTKTDINRMPVDELKVLAAKLGIENAEESTGAALKEEIIKILGL